MNKFSAKTMVWVCGGIFSAIAGQVQADTVKALEARIAHLEAVNAQKGQVHTASGTNLTFYGYARLDMYRDFDYDLGANSSGFSTVNASTPHKTGYGAHAYQTRLGVEGDLGAVQMRLEGDFYGSGGGNFRLRQAYGEYAGFLFGQTASNWDVSYNPLNVLDFNGPAGSGANYRSPQIRYTHNSSDHLQFSVSVEDDATNYNKRPLVTAAFNYTTPKFAINGGAASRKITDTAGDGVSGWGANFSLKTQPWHGGAFTLAAIKGAGISSLLNFGNGVGQQAPVSVGGSNDDTYDIGANGDAVGVKGISLGVSQNINHNLDLSLAYGTYDYDNFVGATPQSLHKLDTAFVTFTYTPVENVMLGLEYMHLKKKLINAPNLSADRLLAVAKFSF